MGSEGTEKDMAVTQVSVGGFDNSVTAEMILAYFEEKIGLVWRCRLKISSTPPNSYPDFMIDTANLQTTSNYEKVVPHAFMHFMIPDSVKLALKYAARGELILGNKPLKISCKSESPHYMNQRMTKTPHKLSDVGVEIGLLGSQNEFFVGWRGPPTGVDFVVDPFDEKCKLLFTKDTAFSYNGSAKHTVIKCEFKVEFLVRDVYETEQYTDTSNLIVLLKLDSAPLVYYRTAEDDIINTFPFEMIDDDDPWIRTTDFTPSGTIGRCNTYRISVPPRHGMKLKRAMDYLAEWRVPNNQPSLPLQIQDETDFGVPLTDPFFCIQRKEGISFNLLFLLNAAIHKGIINQNQLPDRFFDLLRFQREEVNIAALKHICSYRHPVYDAYGRLKIVQEWLLSNPKLLKSPQELADIVEVRRLIITPTKAYCLPEEYEFSNRVLRNYRQVGDRFLRVTFMDEGMETLNKHVLTYYPASIVRDITSKSNPQRTAMFKRVKSIVSNGFKLCGRKYSFLAFSANQLRDRSAWYFAEDKNIRVIDIIKWMGKFTNKNIAKCAARMGQCFSSTCATVEVPRSKVNSKLPDIERNGYVFSDGIGLISANLAKEVAERLQLKSNPPSAFQIRYAGFKGVVACWPGKSGGPHLSLRPSMNKFESNHTVLEICSWSRFQPGFLNRQIITLLSAMDVEDGVFWKMQESMVSKLNQMLEDIEVAYDVLITSCGEQPNTAAIMLGAGFTPQTEPHLRGLLASIRAAQLGDLREKARIFVPSGRWLLGCLDELAVLEEGQCFIQVSNPSLENGFSKHGAGFSEISKNLQVIKGLVVIAKNPCLHPGDVRILEAVDVPGLHYLSDCLVFPQKGERPHANEASGSDLDGDTYFVTWDENLIPPSKRSWPPMDYAPAEATRNPRDVKHKDIKEFFAKNLVNESLGRICSAHVVHADLSKDGAMDEKCLKLAELAAIAVDFPKTGKSANMPFHLKPQMYPDFMDKGESQSYKSNKILGKLYRHVKDAYDNDPTESPESVFAEGIPYDTDLVIKGSANFLDDAWAHKCSYDTQLNRLLRQYEVNREGEIVSGYVWSMPKNSRKKRGELKEKVKHAYNTLMKGFRDVFENIENMDLGFEELFEDEKNDVYEKKASAWYQVTYDPTWMKRSLELQEPNGENVLLSFPWIAGDYLARIKIKCRGLGSVDQNKPIDSLVRYLADMKVGPI